MSKTDPWRDSFIAIRLKIECVEAHGRMSPRDFTGMIDLEREQLHKTYQLCRYGFAFLTASLVPACIITVLTMFALLSDLRLFNQIAESRWSQWINTVCTWGSLVGVMLLWGRWDNKSWQRRCGFLLLLSVVDLVLWFLDRGDAQGPAELSWFRSNLGQALGWAEFALLASLSGDYLVHLGIEQAEDSARSTRFLAAIGAVVWLIKFCEWTDWEHGWPLRRRNPNMHSLLLFLGSELIWTITLLQVTALIIAALRQSNRTLGRMDREDHDLDSLGFPSESAKHDLFSTAKQQGLGPEL